MPHHQGTGGGFAGHQVQQHPAGSPAQGHRIKVDRRNGGVEAGGQLAVVEAGQTYVVRHPDAPGLQLQRHIKGQPVVPAEDAAAEPAKVPAQDEDIPKGDDIGSKLDRILAMLEAKGRGGRGEHPLHDESDLDDMIEKLAGKEDGKSITLPVEEAEDACTGPARDAALAILRNVRPVIAGIADEKVKARVTDALLASIRGKDNLEAISAAATDSAKSAADASSKTTYEQMCADASAAYAARNPHMKKED